MVYKIKITVETFGQVKSHGLGLVETHEELVLSSYDEDLYDKPYWMVRIGYDELKDTLKLLQNKHKAILFVHNKSQQVGFIARTLLEGHVLEMDMVELKRIIESWMGIPEA